jgi:hypothetical protein
MGVPLAQAAARVAALERTLAPARARARRWRRMAGTAAVVAVLLAGWAVAAIPAAINEWASMHAEVNKYDTTTFTLTEASTGLAPVAYSAVATTPGAAAEVDLLLASASRAVPEGDWYYEVTVKEAAATLLASGSYEAHLFVNGVDQGALFFKQATALPLSIEGVKLRWDLGPSLSTAATYVVKITAA